MRALALLRVIAEEVDGLSIAELATALDTHRAGVYRLVGPLNDERMIVRNGRGRYVLGPGMIEFASRVQPRLREVAIPVLRSLADDLQATAALTVRDGDDAVVAAVVEPTNTDLHLTYRPGLRHRLDQAASGIAILAAGPVQQGERAEVARARAIGWAYSKGELLAGAAGVGAAVVLGQEGAESSVSAVWVDDRDIEASARRVVTAAAEISAALV